MYMFCTYEALLNTAQLPSTPVCQTNKVTELERIQKTCLKVILGEMYIGYELALEMIALETLFDLRLKRCLDFSMKCANHVRNNRLFPLNTQTNTHNVRNHETFQVNFAKTSTYRDSTVPFCQRLFKMNTLKPKKLTDKCTVRVIN